MIVEVEEQESHNFVKFPIDSSKHPKNLKEV